MDKKQEKRWKDKLETSYQAMLERYMKKSQAELIACAGEIAAAKLVYEELKENGCSLSFMDDLLEMENPIEELTHIWLPERGGISEIEMDQMLWSIAEKEIKKEESSQMSVKEFLKRYPHDMVSMMTPGGFIDLTPENIKELFQGEVVLAHPGDKSMGMVLQPEEILGQEIVNVNRMEGIWYLMTDEPKQKEEMEEGTLSQEMQIC